MDNSSLTEYSSTPSTSSDEIIIERANISSTKDLDKPLLNTNITIHSEEDENGILYIHGQKILTFLAQNPWVLYCLVAVGVLLVISIVTCICCWLVKHKKRVIEDRREEPIVAQYEDSFEWPSCLKWIFCCRRHTVSSRQNSASNLDPYKRPPLPPISSTTTESSGDGFVGGHLPPNRLMPINKVIDTKQQKIDANDPSLGIHIA